jgi:hypothetical protein
MTDNDLIRLFLPIIQAGLVADGFLDVLTQANNQPTQQGIPTAPTLYFSKINDRRYGWLERDSKWNANTELMGHTEDQWHETMFQVSALVLQNPLITTGYSAANLVNEAASILNSDSARVTLLAAGVGIYRIVDIRNPWFVDDRDQFEASPSFDFTLTHLQTRASIVPIVTSYDVVVNRV